MNTKKLSFEIVEYFCKKVPVKVEDLLRETNKFDYRQFEKIKPEQARKDLSLEVDPKKFLVSYKLPEKWETFADLEVDEETQIELAYIEIRDRYVKKYPNYHKNMIQKTRKYLLENNLIGTVNLDEVYTFGVSIKLI